MNEISLPFHLILPSIISILILGLIWYKGTSLFKNGKRKWFWISVTVFFSIYLFIVGWSTYTTISSEIMLNSFDLNNDGFFTKDEITLDQKAAMKNYISDTGRNFSFITGLIYSGIIAFLVCGIGKIIALIKTPKS
tara:strand:- start:814 stop:1221 length:408 start_codon:yes stop_codon:yes gene_type:complete